MWTVYRKLAKLVPALVVLITGIERVDAGCLANQHVSGGACVACPDGTSNVAGDDITGGPTTCDDIYCSEDEFVNEAHACQACAQDSVRAAGDNARLQATQCRCKENFHALQGTCMACSEAHGGLTNLAGDYHLAKTANDAWINTSCSKGKITLAQGARPPVINGDGTLVIDFPFLWDVPGDAGYFSVLLEKATRYGAHVVGCEGDNNAEFATPSLHTFADDPPKIMGVAQRASNSHLEGGTRGILIPTSPAKAWTGPTGEATVQVQMDLTQAGLTDTVADVDSWYVPVLANDPYGDAEVFFCLRAAVALPEHGFGWVDLATGNRAATASPAPPGLDPAGGMHRNQVSYKLFAVHVTVQRRAELEFPKVDIEFNNVEVAPQHKRVAKTGIEAYLCSGGITEADLTEDVNPVTGLAHAGTDGNADTQIQQNEYFHICIRKAAGAEALGYINTLDFVQLGGGRGTMRAIDHSQRDKMGSGAAEWYDQGLVAPDQLATGGYANRVTTVENSWSTRVAAWPGTLPIDDCWPRNPLKLAEKKCCSDAAAHILLDKGQCNPNDVVNVASAPPTQLAYSLIRVRTMLPAQFFESLKAATNADTSNTWNDPPDIEVRGTVGLSHDGDAYRPDRMLSVPFKVRAPTFKVAPRKTTPLPALPIPDSLDVGDKSQHSVVEQFVNPMIQRFMQAGDGVTEGEQEDEELSEKQGAFELILSGSGLRGTGPGRMQPAASGVEEEEMTDTATMAAAVGLAVLGVGVTSVVVAKAVAAVVKAKAVIAAYEAKFAADSISASKATVATSGNVPTQLR